MEKTVYIIRNGTSFPCTPSPAPGGKYSTRCFEILTELECHVKRFDTSLNQIARNHRAGLSELNQKQKW